MDKQQLLTLRKWAVVGDVGNREKYAYRILKRLEGLGYEVYGVHPRGGDGILTSLAELPFVPEIVCMVINPATGRSFIAEAVQLGVKWAWLQPGADTEEITEFCDQVGLPYVKACVLVETNHM